MENIVEFWLKSLNLSHHFQSFVDNGYDDLETCKRIRSADLHVLGVENPGEQYRIHLAVMDLLEGGATQVYIMAAGCPQSMESPRSVPLSLLTKMVRFRIRNEGVQLSEYTPGKQSYLPLPLVHLAFRYSSLMQVPMEDIELILKQEWIKSCMEIRTVESFAGSSSSEDSCSPYSISTLSVEYSRFPSSCSVPQSLALPAAITSTAVRTKYPCVHRSKSSDCSLSSSSSDSRSPSMERSKENLLDVTSLFSNLRFKNRTKQKIAPFHPSTPKVLVSNKETYGFDSPF